MRPVSYFNVVDLHECKILIARLSSIHYELYVLKFFAMLKHDFLRTLKLVKHYSKVLNMFNVLNPTFRLLKTKRQNYLKSFCAR